MSAKPLPRRAFLQAMAALPLIKEQIEQGAVGAQIGAPLPGGALQALDCPTPMPFPAGKGAELLALSKAGLLPDWYKRALASQSANYGRFIHPDVASMRSLSLSAKLRISAQHAERRALENFERDVLDRQMHQQFMGWS